AHGLSSAGLVIGAWPADPGVAEQGNREALAELAPVRAALPAGAGTLTAAQFAAMSASEVDADWVASLV
ncbi:MAG TPA: dethiobiotin synthase, partial [Mycobacterium sp.]|nr:dethiobiotin synthase [Mycobacterium sp.]